MTNQKAYSFHVNLDKDQDIVDWLDKPGRNRSSALRALIQRDIEIEIAQDSPWDRVLEAVNRIERKLEQGHVWKTGFAQMDAEEPPNITAALDELGVLFQ